MRWEFQRDHGGCRHGTSRQAVPLDRQVGCGVARRRADQPRTSRSSRRTSASRRRRPTRCRPDPSVPETVSAAALPTVQINGVVWDQVIVGNRVFATGQFTQARPAGAAPGTNETPRSNILAYDLTTGEPDHLVGADPQRAGHGDQGLARRLDDLRRRRLRPASTASVAQPHRRARRADRRAAGRATRARTRASTRSRSPATPSTSAATSPRSARPQPGSRAQPSGRGRRDDRCAPAVGADRRPHRQHDGVPPGQRPRHRRRRVQHAQRLHAAGHGLARRRHRRGAAVGREHRDQEPRRRMPRSARSRPTARRSSASAGRSSAAARTRTSKARSPPTRSTGVLDWIDGGRGDNYDIAVAGDVLYTVGHPHDWGMLDWNPQYRPVAVPARRRRSTSTSRRR